MEELRKETIPGHIMPKRGEITEEEINSFFEGSDPMKYIVNVELTYNDAEAHIVYYDYNGTKRIKKESFKPFVWAKNSACIRMFGGNRTILRSKMHEYGIKVKPLYTCTEDNPYPNEKLDAGYKYMFYAVNKMSMGTFQRFFNEAGTPLKSKRKDNEGVSSQEFMTLQPVEQFLIETGKRYFKGYDNYNDIKRMSFDLETEGLNPKKDHISQIGVRTNKGFTKIIPIQGDTNEEKEKNEILKNLEFLEIIRDESPDVIFGHNTENFDWDFIITRFKELGYDYKEVSGKFLPEGIYKQTHPTTLKLGGEVEQYYATQIKYFNVVDSLHAVRRAMATDSSFEKATLKYSTKYLNLKKPNRVYCPGNLIDTVWQIEEPIYAFNDENGDWYRYDKDCDFVLKTKEDFEKEVATYPSFEQYKFECDEIDEDKIRKQYKEKYGHTADELYADYLVSLRGNNDTDNPKVKTMNVLLEGYELKSGRYIVERYLNDDIEEADLVELALHQTDFQLTKIMPTTFMRVCTMGTATQWKLIMLNWAYWHNLAVPALSANHKYTGGLSRLLVTGYQTNICKGDYAALYPTTQITWNIEPRTDIMHVMLPMLKYVLSKREYYKGLKKKSENAAEAIFHELEHMEKTDPEYKRMSKERSVLLTDKINNDNQQLVLKKLANSQFGSLGCPSLFPWGDLLAAEKTTCIGRMLLRIMIYRLNTLGYRPIVGDTDGFDFALPAILRYTDENPYIGKGLNRYSKKGKAYTGAEADFAEFNDMYLNKSYNGSTCNMSANEIDEYVLASINIARKSYICHMKRDNSIKKVGNTIKSRKMSGYMQKFINKACFMLISGDGYGFLNAYYDYIDDIYNYRIPVRDIASKGNIKKELSEYISDCSTTTKAGAKKSRQAWYELAIQNGLKVNQGDTIYYVNTGKKKGETDVKRITHQFVKDPENPDNVVELNSRIKNILVKKEKNDNNAKISKLSTKELKDILAKYIVKEEDEIILNCHIVPNDVIDNEKEYLCSDIPELEYNVEKYIDQFNSRVASFLVCFSTDIRDQILIKNPIDRKYWTREESVLVSGQPLKPSDQDTYEALMKPERKEIEFWEKIHEVPPFTKECEIDWDSLVKEYYETVEKEKTALFQSENDKYLNALNNLTQDDIDNLEESGELPKSITDIVSLNPKDMRFYFINIPDMTPSTGGYLFDDMKLPVVDSTDDE
jgi:DNA polymerase elongation subunit (family B)